MRPMNEQLVNTINLSPDEYRELLLLATVGYKSINKTAYDCFISNLTPEKIEQIKNAAYYCSEGSILPDQVAITVKHINTETERHKALHADYLREADELAEQLQTGQQ